MLAIEDVRTELPGASPRPSLEPLFRGVWRLAPLTFIDAGPVGTRVIVDMTDGVLCGRGLTARLAATAADWYLVGPDGTGTLDWRGRVVTEDGESIAMHGIGRRDRAGDGRIVGACLFETDAEHYRWLNQLQAVYRAALVGEGTDEVFYHDEYYELR